jgi:septal ring factor EnvC (AmiA/AmiB activator)
VVALDYALEESQAARAELQRQLEAAQAEAAELQAQLEQARAGVEAARQRAAGAEAGEGGAAPAPLPPREMRGSDSNFSCAGSECSWAGASAEELLPRIVELWDALYVPLVYR